MKCAPALLACVALLAFASVAQAAQRYAAPSGTGTECSQPAPCSLVEAVSKAKADDEVIITGGAYTLSTGAFLSGEATGANVHGDFGGPPPTISASIFGVALGIFTARSRLSYVDVTNFGESAFAVGCGTEVTIERIHAVAKSKTGSGLLNAGGCTARNSVIGAVGSEAVGLTTNCVSLATGRNLTVIATGEKSVGIRVNYNGGPGGNCTLDLKNAIVSGDQFDLQSTPGSFGPGNIVVEHSNFDVAKQEPGTTITQGAGNQSAPPHFKDAANFDYHEIAGSPTIDAGVNDQPGPVDFDGQARILGSAPDIGAYEFVPPLPPVPPTSPATGLIQSLALAPSSFRTAKSGEATVSVAKAPIGTTVTYSLSAAAKTEFTVERKTTGRKSGKSCVKQTKSNKSKTKCALLKPIRGSFTDSGAAGLNTFKFTGRIAGKALAPGRYELVGSAGGAVKRASFAIVK
jgi:hypothetical protein